MRARGEKAALGVLAFGALAMLFACAPESQAPAVSAPVEQARISILAAYSDEAGVWTPAGPEPAAPSGPAPSRKQVPPSKWCTCAPPAFAPTPEERETFASVQNIIDKLNAHGDTEQAAALQKEVVDIKVLSLQKCVSWCAEQGR